MGAMFRSEEMALAQLFVQPEAAYFLISEFGETGYAQFRDLNENVNAFQRQFINEVRRCNEMERQLAYIMAEVKKNSVDIPDVSNLPKAPNPREIIDLEAYLKKVEGDISELSESAVQLKSNFLQLTELKHVLEKAPVFFNEQDDSSDVDTGDTSPIPDKSESHRVSIQGHSSFVAGVINRERVSGFERMLWRISRGNVFFRQSEIEDPFEDPSTGDEYFKNVFVAFFQGNQLETRVKKVCAGFRASLHLCPRTRGERIDMLAGVCTRLEDLDLVLNQTKDHRQRVLVSVATELQRWSIMVSKMKGIYHVLNFFNMDVIRECLIGECWVPCSDIPKMQKLLADGSNACASAIPSFLNVINTNMDPPTFNRTNKFTRGFQNIIDAYGVASYRELNPALYTIVTFPFLFGVMFGDCGHGVIVTGFALWMILSEKKIAAQKNKNEIYSIFFAGRYIILLMGLFSIYTGFLYNDIFSKSMNVFQSQWFTNPKYFHPTNTTNLRQEIDFLPKANYRGTPYMMGLDPVWQLAKNRIVFLNSFKMKLSIVFGVVHMIFGVCINIFNFLYFKQYSRLFLEFLPQLMFLVFLFLYLVIMMFIKWTMYSGEFDGWDEQIVDKHGSSCAPSVLIYFINMMLMGETEPNKGCDMYMYTGQRILQIMLVVGALMCMPVMLLGKPLYIMYKKRKDERYNHNEINGNNANQGVEPNEVPNSHQEQTSITHLDNEEEEEEPMSEIFIHQAIQTIEYSLSTISHTASYLRLWALSLAHAQLSEVLWVKLFKMALVLPGYFGFPFMFLFFPIWALFTLAILIIMEGLSAFLHTLRLHWVEFMSKFYNGVGHIFQPFSFKRILEEEEEDDE